MGFSRLFTVALALAFKLEEMVPASRSTLSSSAAVVSSSRYPFSYR